MHEVLGPMWIGFIPFSIIVGSLCLAMLSALLIRPWQPRVTFIFIGTIFFLLFALIAASWAGGLFFSLIVPQ